MEYLREDKFWHMYRIYLNKGTRCQYQFYGVPLFKKSYDQYIGNADSDNDSSHKESRTLNKVFIQDTDGMWLKLTAKKSYVKFEKYSFQKQGVSIFERVPRFE